MEKVSGALGAAFEENCFDATFTYNSIDSGITAVAEGHCNIDRSSREEKAQGLIEMVFALDGSTIIVNPDNPINDHTLKQLEKFTGAEQRIGMT